MSVFNKNSVVILGIIFFINKGQLSVAFILKKGEVPIVQQQFAENHGQDKRYEFMPSLQIYGRSILKTTISNVSHARSGDLSDTNKYPAAGRRVNLNHKNNLANISRNIKSKRLRQRCPLNNPKCSKHVYQDSKSRFLEVFQIVQFEHAACTSSTGLEGICLHEFECQSSGGTGMGECADGYGICCVSQFPCDGKSDALMGWFTNPDFPAPTSERMSCVFTLDKASEDIKQLRLDFVVFELLPPSGGVCQQDQFVVSGQNINNIVPILCGINSGQHVYIEVGDVDGPIYCAVQTVSSESRLFSIKITQLAQTDKLAAPPGCLQYFKSTEGYLESFNYRDTSEIGVPRVPSYFNNLNYAICIDRASKTCSITYSNDDEMQIVNYDSDGLPIIPLGQAGVEIFNCPSDWLLIAATRICGYRLNDGSVIQDFTLNAPVTDTNAGPIAIWFRSDEGYVARGFKLQYKQISCPIPATT